MPLDPDLIYFTTTDQRMAQSDLENRIMAELAGYGLPLVPQVKLANNWVFDAAVNGTKLLIEIHGEYWHDLAVVKTRDQRKQEWAAIEGYTIVTIWEQDYEKNPAAAILPALKAWAEAQKPAAIAEASADDEPASGYKGNTGDPKNPPEAPRSSYGDWRDRFLQKLGESGIVREACLAAGISRKTAYITRKADEPFAEDWRMALADAADQALAAYKRRGFQQSDRAMEFFIKSRDPETFSAGDSTIGIVLKYLDLSKLTDEQVEQIAAGGDPLRVLLDDPSSGRGRAPAQSDEGP